METEHISEKPKRNLERIKTDALYRILHNLARTIAIKNEQVDLFAEISSTTIIPNGELETVELGSMKLTVKTFCEQYGISQEALEEQAKLLGLSLVSE